MTLSSSPRNYWESNCFPMIIRFGDCVMCSPASKFPISSCQVEESGGQWNPQIVVYVGMWRHVAPCDAMWCYLVLAGTFRPESNRRGCFTIVVCRCLVLPGSSVQNRIIRAGFRIHIIGEPRVDRTRGLMVRI